MYILSFAFVGIYWNNHHHLLRATRHISGGVMWANLYLLFWLSLIPVITEWVGNAYRKPWPAATYGIVAIGGGDRIHDPGHDHRPGQRPARPPWPRPSALTAKGRLSIVLYAAGIGFAFVSPWISYALYASVSVIWFIPDRRLSGQITSG